jgi:DNA-binding IclR family transcriptional regulator
MNHQAEGAQTARRAIRVLRVITDSDEPLGLTEVARRAGLNKPGAHRLLLALAAEGIVERAPGGRRYAVGGGLVALSAMVLRRVELRRLARPAMERLTAETSETVSLYVRHELDRVCVEVVEGPCPVRWVIPVGDSQPLHVGLTGRVILAFLPDADVAAALAGVARSVDRTALHDHLARVREQGYLAEPGQRVPEVNGVSAPIFDGSGVVAALTISGPADRFAPAVARAAGPDLLRETRRLSMSLGAPARPRARAHETNHDHEVTACRTSTSTT